jgi:glucan 1,3-beta-glucosidase
MPRISLLFATVAILIGGFWYWMGLPVAVPPSPLAPGEKLNCISYAPFHDAQAPFATQLQIPEAVIARDLAQLSEVTSCVRTYSAARIHGKITRLVGPYGLKVLQGIWLGRNRAENRREVEAALKLARTYPGVVQAFIVGNETLLRGELSAADVAHYVEEVRRRGWLPVTYADVWEFWLRSPELARAVDFVTIHILPYWEDDPVSAGDAVAHLHEIHAKVAAAFPGKEILIGEVGWPSQGRMRAGALPSPANQARVLAGVVAAAKQAGWKVNLIEAYDQPWKRLLEGITGGYWGLFDDSSRELKFRWGEPVSNHPHWRLQAGLGIGAVFVVFLMGWVGSRGSCANDWRADLGVACMALASGLMFGWAAVKFPMEVPVFGDQLRTAGLLGLALAVPTLASFALARGLALPPFALALNPCFWRRTDRTSVVLSVLFVATVLGTTHVALGLVFDSRYKDFPFVSLTAPVVALALIAIAPAHRPDESGATAGAAEIAMGALLGGSALFIAYNQGLANWQALWFAGLLLVLSLIALRAPVTSAARALLWTPSDLAAQPAPD